MSGVVWTARSTHHLARVRQIGVERNGAFCFGTTVASNELEAYKFRDNTT